MKYLLVTDKEGNMIVDNLLPECNKCYNECNTIGNLVNTNSKCGSPRRQGKITNSKSTVFLCCDVTKTTKLFRQKIEALSYAYQDLIIPKKEIEYALKKTEQQKVNRLVHNLTSINGYNIQEIYNLVPQSVLSTNWKNQIDFIEKEIFKNPKETAMMFLRIAKNNIHMKSEFSIYRKLDREDTTPLEFNNLSIRNVIINILHTFFADFSSKGIYVDVAEFYEKVKIDYETIQVAIYHLIENALKYSKPNSNITIDFQIDPTNIDVRFSMVSAYVKPSERPLVFNEGFSGEMAKKMGKEGDGIGMWRIKQMMEINNGSCSAIFGDRIEQKMGYDFSDNAFILSFKRAITNEIK